MNTFNFYVPFINDKKAVDKYIEMNQQMSKSKIKAVYAECPLDGFDNTFKENILTLKEHEIDVILNLEYAHKFREDWFANYYIKIHNLIEIWMNLGFNSISVTNMHLIQILSTVFPTLNIICSYKQGLTSIKQYSNMLKALTSVSSISPACAVNHDTDFLKNLNNHFQQNIQIVVNNGCKLMCYRTFSHLSWLDAKQAENTIEKNFDRWTSFYFDCFEGYKKDFWKNLIMSDMIYPWQLEGFVKETKINDFRLILPKYPANCNYQNNLNFICFYLAVVEDYDKFKDYPFYLVNGYLIDKIFETTISLNDIKTIIPEVSFFNHTEGPCRDTCGISCNKCSIVAKQLEELSRQPPTT